ncbi:protein gprD [Aspergillus undulatus]|uniref:protein gprD n=1 Tax=Aspergillus undulatus TaxID=1810928 RepID=UPI003CCCE6F4
MAALIRAIALLQSDHGQNEAHQLVSRQAQYVEPVDSPTKAGFIAIGICGLVSFVATLSLFLFLIFRFIFWSRYYKQPLQATAFLMCLHWVSEGAVYYPSAACILQGWWIQTADPGSGLFVIAIAIYTGVVVLRGQQLPYRAFVGCVIGLWAFILVLGFIPVGLYGSETFQSLKRLNRVVIYMLIYPFVYVVLSLPLAAGRISSARHVEPSRQYFAVAGSLMALSGLGDAVVYALTRRQLLLDTDLSRSDGLYTRYAYSGSHTYHTQITSTTGGRERKLGSRFRKGMQALDETVQDNRDDSTEKIVKGARHGSSDVKLTNMNYTGPGVYQETTIEITHEAADSQGFHHDHDQPERHNK